jgi:hypothetical protein
MGDSWPTEPGLPVLVYEFANFLYQILSCWTAGAICDKAIVNPAVDFFGEVWLVVYSREFLCWNGDDAIEFERAKSAIYRHLTNRLNSTIWWISTTLKSSGVKGRAGIVEPSCLI